MILKFILLISIGQILLYLISDRVKFKLGRTLILIAVLIGHVFVFPQFFYPELNPDGINCGMPLLGITLAFWIIGGGLTLLVHLIYYLVKIKVNKG